MIANSFSSLQGVENVYAQHVPLVMSTINRLSEGKLKDSAFPVVYGNPQTKFIFYFFIFVKIFCEKK